MDLDTLKKERSKWLKWKNIAPKKELIDSIEYSAIGVELKDTIKIVLDKDYEQKYQKRIEEIAKELIPWRKGPFQIGSLFIDSEWRSYIKYNLLEKFFNLKDKAVADVGCNNGYYLFRMLKEKPKRLVGFDPSPHYYLQFYFLNNFIQAPIDYELLGVEHLELFKEEFDTIFCLGVLYHRRDPIGALKSLYKALRDKGELFLDTFMIDGDSEVALTPRDRYSKIPNIYFIPTKRALENWCLRAGFKSVEILAIKETTLDEQRKTSWISGESLDDFLDPNNPNLTVEGYPAPKRLYIRAIK
ncbi:MAG: tRNA 5-methoxyuridine(34)/uridine 5-oxyacetic acid(34) synthase CmoB [Epsilonproteobacteria bacterium]|nr:tRNA 5-methoxyuridine(34)/uridine 5-oxyacetic acid(34) synthase CmoB [Campylobacterota bacterium]